MLQPSPTTAWPQRRVTRRQALATSLAPGAAAALAGCSPLPGPAPAASVGGGEIRFLHWFSNFLTPLEPVITEYQERTKTKITVELIGLGDYPAKVTAAFAADAAPDLLFSYSQNDSKYYDAGSILDLSDRWKRDKFTLGDYALMGTERWCAKGYGMPFYAEPFSIYYNKTLLRQNGLPDPWDTKKGDWTWDDLVELARRVTRPARGDEPAGIFGIWWPYANVTYFGPNIWTFGGDHVDFEHMTWKLDSPVSLEAYQRFSRWVRTDKIALADGTPEAKAIAAAYSGRDPFSAGRALFRFRSITDLVTYQKQVGSDFEWDILPVPKQGNQVGVSMTAGHPHIIWARSKYPDQTYDFAKHLAGPEVQELVGKGRVALPALKAKFDTFLTPPPVPHASVFTDVYKKPRGIHFRHHNTPENWDQYGAAITPLLLGEKPLQAGLQELNQQVNAKVEYGTCAPYKGLKHPLPPGV